MADDESENEKKHDHGHQHHEAPEPADTPPAAPAPARTGPHHKLWAWVCSHKKISIPAGVLLLLAVLAAVPFTRYVLAGTVLRQNFTVAVVDSQTDKPVTGATVQLEGKSTVTNNKGQVTIHANVGYASLTVSKKYYTTVTQNVLVPIGKQKGTERVSFKATGRQVPVTVNNIISGKGVANISVKALGAVSKTDAKGEAILVLPADKSTVDATLSGDSYNDKKVTVKITGSVDAANTFQITPAGKIYFLSDQSGTLDVVKSNLDGTDRKIALAGTGNEEKANTVLLASRDWRFIALLSKREGGDYAKLFLIDTSNDQVTTMDEGEATFGPKGWSDHRFIYTVSRQNVDEWQSKRQAIKSYDASSKKITVLDESSASGDQNGYVYEDYANVFILDQDIVFLKRYFGGGYNPPYDSKQNLLVSVKADGLQRKTIKTYPVLVNGYTVLSNLLPGSFGELYIVHGNYNDKGAVESYEDGKVSPEDMTPQELYQKTYPTYIVSPSGKYTFWNDYRDGKNFFLVGDDEAKNGKQLEGASEDYVAYGWFTDDYLLVTRKGSEMHILPMAGLPGGVEKSLKISDYFKPNYYNPGYGYGYGG